MQALENDPEMMSNMFGRTFRARLETANNMKPFSPAMPSHGCQMPSKSNQFR
jgi:hypothetical protein